MQPRRVVRLVQQMAGQASDPLAAADAPPGPPEAEAPVAPAAAVPDPQAEPWGPKRGRQEYFIMDAAVGVIERGSFKVEDCVKVQPWLPDGPIPTDVTWKLDSYQRVSYPPAPSGKRHYQLSVDGVPVRLRLVAVAPVGKRPVGKVDSVLEQVLRGLGEVSIDDKPRIRVWPPQLSSKGFAPTFFRLTHRPEPEGKPSRWILLAGPARAGSMPVLLGLACQADKPSTLGLVTVDELQWGEILEVQNA